MIDRSDPRRAAYVAMTEALIEDFRAHNGEVTSGPFAGRTVLLLTTIGAKSGKPRLAPLIYTLAGDGYVIAASSGGSPANPAGFANLVANPVVTVELGGETFTVRARVTEGDDRDRLWAEHVAAHPGIDRRGRRCARHRTPRSTRWPRPRIHEGRMIEFLYPTGRSS